MDFTFRGHVVTMLSLLRHKLLIVVFFNIIVYTQASSWLIIANIAPFGRRVCDQLPFVLEQKTQCLRYPSAMESVKDGALLGIDECQFQFRNERWNCSGIRDGPARFDRIMQRGSQEAGFFHAITSAGVVHAVTQACSRGDLNDCSCDRNKRGKSLNGSFYWGGCSDDIRYGISFAQRFIDASETNKHDARANMNRHNNKVGRRAVKLKSIVRKCKCHGSTATCATKTCWDELTDFRLTGSYLKRKYDNAVHVTVRQDGTIVKSNPEDRQRPNKDDLLYLDASPNYCVRNDESGSLGTSGRECNASSTGKSSCTHLCCGRGHDTMRATRVEQCGCKFRWCCQVECENCSEELDVHTCKPELPPTSIEEQDSTDAVTRARTSTNPPPTTVSTTTRKARTGRRGRRRGRTDKKKGRKKGRTKGKKRRQRKTAGGAEAAPRSRRDVFYEEEIDLDDMMDAYDSTYLSLDKNKNDKTIVTDSLLKSPKHYNDFVDSLMSMDDIEYGNMDQRTRLYKIQPQSSRIYFWWKQFWAYLSSFT